MAPAETATILRQLHDWLKGGTQWAPTRGAEAVEAAVEMIERMKSYETALREIEWSNDTKWQADRARAALEESK